MRKPSGRVVVCVVLSLVCGAAAAQTRAPEAPPAARTTPNSSFGTLVKSGAQPAATNFGVLLGGTTDLEQQLEAEAAKSAGLAQAFGASLSAADRRALQGACSTLVASPADAAANSTLQHSLSRHSVHSAETIVRFCLEPAITRLRSELHSSRQSLERLQAASGDPQANVDLQNVLQQQQRTFTSISNVMKTKHDTAKNAISNIR